MDVCSVRSNTRLYVQGQVVPTRSNPMRLSFENHVCQGVTFWGAMNCLEEDVDIFDRDLPEIYAVVVPRFRRGCASPYASGVHSPTGILSRTELTEPRIRKDMSHEICDISL
eukprot:1260281-Amorphochlora_amoeboformis.AAC.1